MNPIPRAGLARRSLAALLVLAAAAGLAALGPAAPAALAIPAASADPARLKQAVAAIEAWQRAGSLPGFSVVIATAKGTAYTGAWGLAELGTAQAMGPDTVVGMGSITKSITALAIMQLAEAGAIGLDDPVVKHLPWFRLADKAVSDTITIRHCLNNASGIPSRDAWVNASRNLDEAEIERDVRSLNAVKSRGTPGQSFEYTNENWSILGLIIKKASGMDYGRYVQAKIFDPLGMDRTTTQLDRLESSGAIAGSRFTADGFERSRPAWVAAALPAGSCLVSTARDFGRYLSFLLSGGTDPAGRPLVSPAGLAQLWQGSVRFPLMESDMKGADQPGFYAMGWIRAMIDGRELVFHGGNTMRTTTMTALDPATGFGISILANSPGELDRYRHEQALVLANRVLHILAGEAGSDWGAPLGPDPKRREPAIDPGEEWLAGLAGEWISGTGMRLGISREAGKPSLLARIDSNQIAGTWRVEFLDRGRVRLSNPGGCLLASFNLGSDGTVRSLSGLMGMEFRRRLVGEGERAIRLGPWESRVPRAWEARGQGASGLDLVDGAAGNRVNLGWLPAAAGRELGQRLALARQAAGLGADWGEGKLEQVTGAWSNGLFWESLVLVSEGGRARELAWCQSDAGLLWLSLEAPLGQISAVNRLLVRPFQANLVR